MWSSTNFKSILSPQELVQEISVESKKRFSIGQRQECTNLLVWLLAILNRDLKKSKNTSPVYEPFQVSFDLVLPSFVYCFLSGYSPCHLFNKAVG
jgi:hypothetical protein